MRRALSLSALMLALSGQAQVAEITLVNPAPFSREGEIVEVGEADLKGIVGSESFVIRDASGKEIPWQATHDGKVVFQISMGPGATEVVTAQAGTPAPFGRKTYGRLFPERLDDMTWENDLMSYRAYGPALQLTGERAFGYDVWTKNVDYPILEKRYTGSRHGISFHQDHGDGMDVYAVGPTLGGGATALLDKSDVIIYPWCFSEHLVLDNGPLRFTVLLHYPPMGAEKGIPADETRVITLDAGDPFNRTVVTYNAMPEPSAAVAGQVVHKQNPEAYLLDSGNCFAAYADLTQNAEEGNGTIYVGMLGLDGWTPGYLPMEKPEGDAIGHTVLQTTAENGKPLTYWWGAAWSKGGTDSMDKWRETILHKRRCLLNPIRVSVAEKR